MFLPDSNPPTHGPRVRPSPKETLLFPIHPASQTCDLADPSDLYTTYDRRLTAGGAFQYSAVVPATDRVCGRTRAARRQKCRRRRRIVKYEGKNLREPDVDDPTFHHIRYLSNNPTTSNAFHHFLLKEISHMECKLMSIESKTL